MAKGKGLSLEEFRKSLESDATKELADLKAENENLAAGNKYLKKLGGEQLATMLKQKTLIGQLCNRCYALSSGIMCQFCECRMECPHSPGNQFIEQWKKGELK